MRQNQSFASHRKCLTKSCSKLMLRLQIDYNPHAGRYGRGNHRSLRGYYICNPLSTSHLRCHFSHQMGQFLHFLNFIFASKLNNPWQEWRKWLFRSLELTGIRKACIYDDTISLLLLLFKPCQLLFNRFNDASRYKKMRICLRNRSQQCWLSFKRYQ